MGRRVEVHYLSPVVEQHNETVQNIESHSRYDEEINCCNLIRMIPQKALPRLRRRLANSDPILCHCRFCHFVTKQMQLCLDARYSPGRIFM